jgi:hypothetical protein
MRARFDAPAAPRLGGAEAGVDGGQGVVAERRQAEERTARANTGTGAPTRPEVMPAIGLLGSQARACRAYAGEVRVRRPRFRFDHEETHQGIECSSPTELAEPLTVGIEGLADRGHDGGRERFR